MERMVLRSKTRVLDEQERRYWNIMKGIAVVLVVAGHGCSGYVRSHVSDFIYLFHLPLFFFVSGYLYSEEKYGDSPYDNIAGRLKSSWMKYVVIYWFLILIHNLLFQLQMLEEGAVAYSLSDMLREMAKAALGMGHELMGGALWFVPAVVMTSSLLGIFVCISRRLFAITGSHVVKYGAQFLMIAACTVAGYAVETHGIDLSAHFQVVLVVMPFPWVGYLLRNIEVPWEKVLHPAAAVVFAIVLWGVSRDHTLDLVFGMIFPYMHITAFMGIYLCLVLGRLVQKGKGAGDIVSQFGQASFWIMAIHFPVLRLTDWIYTVLFVRSDFTRYREIPVAYTGLWPVYLLLGLGIPMLCYLAWGRLRKHPSTGQYM